ncbi:MAG: MFS transporter [Acidimicrobiia bacterium]
MPQTELDPRRLLPLILTVTGMGVLAFAVIAPVLPDLADELGVSRGSIGLVQGAVAIPGIFLAAYIGYLADRFGRRRVIRVSLIIFGVFGLACFFARSYWVLVGFRILQGLGTSGLLSLGVVLIGDLFTGMERRWAMGLNLAALTMTTTLAPIAGGFIAEGGAFRPFLIYVLAFPVFFMTRRLPDPKDATKPSPPFRHLREAMQLLKSQGKRSDFLGVLPMSLITLGVFLGLGLTVLPLFLEREFGLGVSQRGLVAAILSGSSSLASVFSGRVGSLFTPRQVLTSAFTFMVVGFTVIGLAPSLWILPLGLIVLGLATGSIFPLLQDYSASVGPTHYRGMLVGTWVSANRVGQFAGPAGGTALADSIGDRRAYFAGAAVMGVIAVTWMPLRKLGKRISQRGAG